MPYASSLIILVAELRGLAYLGLQSRRFVYPSSRRHVLLSACAPACGDAHF